MVVIPIIDLDLNSTAAVSRVDLERRAHYLAMYELDHLLATNVRGDQTDTTTDPHFRIEVATTPVETTQYPIDRLTVAVYLQDTTNAATNSEDQEQYGEVSAYLLHNQ